MAMHTHPIPHNPYNLSSPTLASLGSQVMHPSPYVPIRLCVFTPMIFLNDCIVGVLSFCTRWCLGMHTTMLSCSQGPLEHLLLVFGQHLVTAVIGKIPLLLSRCQHGPHVLLLPLSQVVHEIQRAPISLLSVSSILWQSTKTIGGEVHRRMSLR